MRQMMRRLVRNGQVSWIGLRPARRIDVVAVDAAMIGPEGLEGDHGRPGKRAVTLMQGEHLDVIAAFLGRKVRPEDVRRNILITGANLAAFRKSQIRIGTCVLMVEGPCPPCSRMEEGLGHGGYSALRGHGGFYASVVTPGRVALGCEVAFS